MHHNPIGCHRLAWLKAHQLEAPDLEDNPVPNPRPCSMLVQLNERADASAKTAAAHDAPHSVKVPAGSTCFFLMHEGRMITSDEGDYMRNLASSQALRAWSARPVMGAMAGVQRDLAPASVQVV